MLAKHLKKNRSRLRISLLIVFLY